MGRAGLGAAAATAQSGRRDGELHVETLMLALGLTPVVVSEALQ